VRDGAGIADQPDVIEEGFRAAKLPPLQTAATQPLWDVPNGIRVTELAKRARITKQSMGEMVDAMEAAGYVERIPDPSDARARLVCLSAKGRAAGRLARKLVREVEDEWAEAVGAARLTSLRETLRMIVSTSRAT
jgi:DNA-binding MarR family transcriptional regulator